MQQHRYKRNLSRLIILAQNPDSIELGPPWLKVGQVHASQVFDGAGLLTFASFFISDPDMKNHHRSMLYSALLFLAFSVAACAGGGSGASPSTSASAGDSASTPKNLPAVQSVIDQSNYVNTAAHAYLAPESLAGITRLNDMLVSGVSVNTKAPGLTELATDVLRQLVGKQASTVTAVIESASCPGGGTAKVSSSGDSLDNMKPGDVISLEASNCGVSGLKSMAV
jgi:hypothetical protein